MHSCDDPYSSTPPAAGTTTGYAGGHGLERSDAERLARIGMDEHISSWHSRCAKHLTI